MGVDPNVHFVGKNLDRKLVAKLPKEFNLSKGGREYDVTDIQLTKNAKYPIPLSPMSKDIQEEGALLGHIPNL